MAGNREREDNQYSSYYDSAIPPAAHAYYREAQQYYSQPSGQAHYSNHYNYSQNPPPLPPPNYQVGQPQQYSSQAYHPPPPLPAQAPPSSLQSTKQPSSSSQSNSNNSKLSEEKPVRMGNSKSASISKDVDPEEKKTSITPILVGKRRGKGRALPTGVVKKAKTDVDDAAKPKDAWSQYMNEVRRYKDQSCDDDRKNRPLVK